MTTLLGPLRELWKWLVQTQVPGAWVSSVSVSPYPHLPQALGIRWVPRKKLLPVASGIVPYHYFYISIMPS